MVENRGPGRPKDEAKGSAILEAAWDMFLERGVGAVSIEGIAARAGVSKMTVYNHYTDKNDLFEAAVLRKAHAIEAAQVAGPGFDDDADLRGKLRAFGVGLLSFLASDFAIDFYGVVNGELGRHPELARIFFEAGPARTVRNLAALLARHGDQLAVDDPMSAAEALVGLWQGISNYQLASRLDVDSFRDRLVKRVECGIDVFMRAFACPSA